MFTTLARWFAWLLMVLTPALMCLAIMVLQGVSLAEYAPGTNDEVGYYLQTNAFVHKGLNGGYFTISEKPAPARFSHFGVHGPLFPILYGLVGKAIGWQLYSGPLFNVGFLTLSLAIFCLVVKPTTFQALFGAIFLATYWPLYLSLISNWQDPIHFSAAVLYASAFVSLLSQRPLVQTKVFRAAFWLLLIYSSLMRISWAMMALPYLLLDRPMSSWKDVRRLAIGVAVVLALLYTFRWLCAPYLGDDTAFLMNKIIALETAPIGYLLGHAWHNVRCLLLGEIVNYPCLPGMLVFYGALALGAVMIVLTVRAAFYPLRQRQIPIRPPEGLFHCYNVWGLTAAMIFLYYVDRDGGWRMFSSHFLLAALMIIVSATPRLSWLIIIATAINLACALPCLENVFKFNVSRFGDVQNVHDFANCIKGLIAYEDGADPWCNTVLADRYPPCFAGLPPGIGVSVYLRAKEFPHWPKSRYLLIKPNGEVVLPVPPKAVFRFPRGRFFGLGAARAGLVINPLSHGSRTSSMSDSE
jgi:hypothetical protein